MTLGENDAVANWNLCYQKGYGVEKDLGKHFPKSKSMIIFTTIIFTTIM
jgi:hypothetical protein